MDQLQDFLNGPLGTGVANFLYALIILILGYIVARIVAGAVRQLLRRTQLDNRIADAVAAGAERPTFDVEDLTGRAVFWVIMLFVFVAFFQRLGLTGLARPLDALLQRVTTEFLPNLVGALLLLLVAWLLATALKYLVSRGAELLKIDERLGKYGALEEGEEVSVAQSLATAVFWFVFLLFLPAVMERLGISEIAQPIQDVFSQALGYIPNIFAAAVTLLIGWFIARLVRQIVSNLLAAVGVDRLGERVGLTGAQSISRLTGTVLYTFILLFSLISALDSLAIEAISGPATLMLTTIINAIPNLFGAALVLAISYFIGRLVAGLVTELLRGMGTDNWPEKLGLNWTGSRSLSEWVGYLIMVGVMLFAALSASELLGSSFLSEILATFISFLGQLVLALIIFVVGLYLANLARQVILGAGGQHAQFSSMLARVAILVLSGAMALRQLGVADDIVNLAFGVMLGALGIAAALAFGLGSREIAGREVERFVGSLRSSGADDD
jgi:hypothetical protein